MASTRVLSWEAHEKEDYNRRIVLFIEIAVRKWIAFQFSIALQTFPCSSFKPIVCVPIQPSKAFCINLYSPSTEAISFVPFTLSKKYIVRRRRHDEVPFALICRWNMVVLLKVKRNVGDGRMLRRRTLSILRRLLERSDIFCHKSLLQCRLFIILVEFWYSFVLF